ncbi:butyrophilin-like protein 10 [Carassius auratus]|uniref:Butyrophilin-like protein 10 n=1 Tax=Carassius auratus TaxID=7957 RepID=A0A6P6MI55_CARAU|nr:butyrophilin-like protein 10 [Carassius auratus]
MMKYVPMIEHGSYRARVTPRIRRAKVEQKAQTTEAAAVGLRKTLVEPEQLRMEAEPEGRRSLTEPEGWHPYPSKMNFIFLTLLIISGITYSRSDQYEVVSPADTIIALAGEDVILPCSVKPSISVVDMKVEWFRSDLKDSQLVHLYEDHDDRNTEQLQSYRGRTKLNPQELQRGDASLKLSSVRVSDEGRYKCFIQSKSWSDDATVDVSVEAVGSPPVITVDGFDQSGGLRLQCESEGWNPEPFLEWLNIEGVRISSETTEMQRNTDGFSVKHTITVQHRDDKIHCRVRLRHHMLETLILTSSKSFYPWRTLIILSTIAAVLVVISGILLAVFVRKNRVHS